MLEQIHQTIGFDAPPHGTFYIKWCTMFFFGQAHLPYALKRFVLCIFRCDWLSCRVTGHTSQINGPVQPHLLKEYRKTPPPPPSSLHSKQFIHLSVRTTTQALMQNQLLWPLESKLIVFFSFKLKTMWGTK